MFKFIFLLNCIYFAYLAKVPLLLQNDNTKIPIVGLGTGPTGVASYQAVRDALEAGYRHIDTALDYGNEKEIGRAVNDLIKEGKVKREELYIVSKLHDENFERTRVHRAINESLNNLQLKYVDLFLVHKPPKSNDMIEIWKGMEDIHKQGLAKSIGVANFDETQIDTILMKGSVKPVTNQVYCNPYKNQNKLLKYLTSKNISLTAYNSLGGPQDTSLLKNTKLVDIGHKHNVTSAQVLLRYQVQRNVIVIPKSVNKKYIIENINIFDFTLTDNDIKIIETLNKINSVFQF